MKKFLAITAVISALALNNIHSVEAKNTPYNEMPAGVYTLDKTHASLTWRVSHLGLSMYTARFNSFDADLNFDPAMPEHSKVTATIDPISVETDYPYPEQKDFDTVLAQDKKWFNAANFPEITFESKEITRTSDTTGTMMGHLTLLGVTKPLIFDITFNGAMEKQPFSRKPTLGFSATATLKRSEWGMASYVPNIGDEVELVIEAEFIKT